MTTALAAVSAWLSHRTEVNGLIAALAWAHIVVIMAALVGTRRNQARQSRTWNTGLTGVFLAASLLRAFLPPWSFIHENSHGVVLFNEAASFDLSRPVYGLGYVALHGPLQWLAGGDMNLLFGVQALLSALCAPMAALVMAEAFPRLRSAALLSGLAVAVHPTLIRFGPTETLFTPALLFLLTGLWLLLRWGRHGRTLSLAGALSSLAVSAQMRPEFWLLTAVAAVAVLWRPAPRARLRRQGASLAGTAWSGAVFGVVAMEVMLTALPLHNAIYYLLWETPPSASLLSFDSDVWRGLFDDAARRPWQAGAVPFAPAFTPYWMILATLAGAIALAWREKADGLMLILAPLLTALLLWLPVQNAPLAAARLEQPAVLFACMLAGVGLVVSGRAASGLIRFPPWRRPALAVALGLLIVGGLASHWTLLTHRFDTQHELAFLRTTCDALPYGSRIELPPADPVVVAALPLCDRCFTRRDIRAATSDDEPSPEHPRFAYLGLACYRFSSQKDLRDNGGLRPACRRMLAGAVGDPPPGCAADLHADPPDFLKSPQGVLRIGFWPLDDAARR